MLQEGTKLTSPKAQKIQHANGNKPAKTGRNSTAENTTQTKHTNQANKPQVNQTSEAKPAKQAGQNK